ncbi:RagB/SusD family nutrient uptake outer membrane protein [Halalkalibaculum roseum]|nr:RagB/SusD family nutrient uptake outer membrane protein [Halalkalibaculum roseum]
MYRRISKPLKGCLVAAFSLMFVFTSCTDLDETINSEVTSDQFFQTDQEFISALGDAYSPLTIWGQHNTWTSMLHISSDEGIITVKGTDWEDGGIWVRMKRHTYLYDDPEINNAWTALYSGVNNANRLIFQFESLVESGDVSEEDAASFIAELKVLRAFYYYQLLDGWGNVPLITSFADAPENPANNTDFQAGRTEIFNFVEQELLDNVNLVSDDAGSTYGRVNEWVARMILAKLYLNAEVYTGTPRWQDAVDQADLIIDSGNYSLVSNYRDNFVTNNSGSPELMFVVPYDRVFLTGFNLAQMTLHYQSQNTYNLQEQPWNGYAAMEEAYTRYIDPASNPGPQGEVWGTEATSTDDGLNRIQGTQDERLVNMIVGPQFDAQGNRLEDASATAADPNGTPLTFTPEIMNLQPDGLRQGGARVGKFEFAAGATANLSNDYPIFRYADVLLTKAEALWRMDNSDPEALRLVNLIRNRANVDDYSAPLTADKILDERGREMFWEVTRRQDLIRFDGTNGGATRFNDPWTFKEVSDANKNVFPIPRDQCEANENLVQNTGYTPCPGG